MNNNMDSRTRTDVLLLVAFCGFLFFYGLGAFGLLGADEPRYAQVAREMLERGDWVTPTLLGKVWLEKPVLYYWQAMVAFKLAGVSDRTARWPGAFDATLLVVAIYLFLRKFRLGSELDGALITASCAGMIGFGRAAATDMPLAACFGVALLGWYAWYESGRRTYLAGAYFFLALGTLAKGPVAPALCAVIIILFCVVKRDWRRLVRTVWIPGIALYLIVMLPWYVAVQLRNPEFFRVFILEHNLGRFSLDMYHHRQPFWFYLPVFLLAVMPWIIVLISSLVEWWKGIRAEGRNLFSDQDDTWRLFLLIWMIVPIVFFSASQSKLPGYILPAVPAGTLLATDYLVTQLKLNRKFSLGFAAAHGLLCGVLVLAAVAASALITNRHWLWDKTTLMEAAIALIFAIGVAVVLMSRSGLRLLRPVTLLAVVICVAAVNRFAAPAIDTAQSARPIAEGILAFSHEPVPLAIYKLNRVQEYGLEFYLNRPAQKYDDGNVPAAAHVVVAAQHTQTQITQQVTGRRVSYLMNFPAQKLDLYWVE